MFLDKNPEQFAHLLEQSARTTQLLCVKAPGRINLIGEHTDYNGGKVLPFAINKHITLTCRRLSHTSILTKPADYVFTSSHTQEIFTANFAEVMELKRDSGPRSLKPLYTTDLPDVLRKSWAAYALGALHTMGEELARNNQTAQNNSLPLWIHIESDLPVGAGISSSAALTTGLLMALYTLNGLKIDRTALAKSAMLIEHYFIGTKCGLMDQLAVLLSEKNSLLLVDFIDFPKNQSFSFKHIKAHARFANYQLVGINTGVKHNLSDSPYNERRAACESMVDMLNQHFKSNFSSLGDFAAPDSNNPLRGVIKGIFEQDRIRHYLESQVLTTQSDRNKLARFAAHAICENERVNTACDALMNGREDLLDKAMHESHLSLQHDYQVSCEELDLIKKCAKDVGTQIGQKRGLKELAVLGPRMTGGGFGGSTIQLVHTSILNDFVDYFASPSNDYTKRIGIEPKMIVTPLEAGLIVNTP